MSVQSVPGSPQAGSQVLWRGHPIEQLTAPELRQAVRELMSMLRRYQEPGMSEAIALGQVERMRRGLR